MKTAKMPSSPSSPSVFGHWRFGCVASFSARSQANAAQARQVIRAKNKKQQGDVGVGALFSAHENPTKPVHPTMRSLEPSTSRSSKAGIRRS
jgi:hypothetical protein